MKIYSARHAQRSRYICVDVPLVGSFEGDMLTLQCPYSDLARKHARHLLTSILSIFDILPSYPPRRTRRSRNDAADMAAPVINHYTLVRASDEDVTAEQHNEQFVAQSLWSSGPREMSLGMAREGGMREIRWNDSGALKLR